MVNLTVKKVYCPKCQKLVRIKQQETGGKSQFNCVKCTTLIWQKDNRGWKYNQPA